MIEHTQGNLLSADAEALVNTVNCVGYMGKGIALQFKQAFPENFKAYQRACKAEEVRPGRMFVFETGNLVNPRYIINFPTKNHWRGKSRMQDIEQGLQDLIAVIRRLNIRSVAIPPLGSGLGGLNWLEVKPRIEAAFADLADVHVLLYEPKGAPEAARMLVRTKRPHWTVARALFISLMDRYGELDYRRTLLEIQKLAYFLQEAGEGLRLRYEKGLYGPYAHNLNKVLETLEGHYTRGFGDSQKPDTEIELMDGAVDEAERFLAEYQESRERLDQVTELIAGFETPYGMELLSSVHWVAAHDERLVSNADEAVEAVHAWNDRKRSMFQPKHIRVAWRHLEDHGWLGLDQAASRGPGSGNAGRPR
ncbi:macro domain-containing protein [Wenzhouxiangella sp. AB-CW3]|uniref:type II toxin-antitoxin system antitoxin DNA ADP-ribosyl glycohydrolase DarG n=1 Tax=Wenzhouxiangella sp. AB-CW3 TaxID=2771012 RepID=UPI00168B94D1|nr:macro domain-containing protein [Wenzhouxiangella sp. AB-CW3]QOC22750.1 macro domain-containing protein [Wenzhouxiangella sp. AB-CW3]